jgi:hypothetical protein
MAVGQPRTGALADPFDSDVGRQPAGYRLRVFLLGLLGYGYILGVLALLAAAIAAALDAAAGTRGSRLWAAKLVFALVARGLVFREASVHAIAADLACTLDLPGETLVVALVGENTRFGRPLKKVAGAEVYRR